MDNKVTFKGNPLTLSGKVVEKGNPAPGFKALKQDLSETGLADFMGKVKILTSFPSLDTPVCDLQVKEFNKRAVNFSPDVAVIGISMDLPFAQKRFCQENDINHVTVVSDHRDASFGLNYGLLIKELRLLARSIIIVDKEEIVRYIQVVREVTSPPDYEAALKALQDILKG
ncbi:MAG: thiol peroxidase [Candidatus Omnitrophica bacterium]|nr:thiol peroxidase [Candidatus Omnitrophota bacterium]MDD5737698.1 thiol peroxidase [Candidatus Omnitrophota bacterium]